MDTVNPAPGESADTPMETEAERRRRRAWEVERIAEARAELDTSLYVEGDEIDARIDSMGTDHGLPPPSTRQR